MIWNVSDILIKVLCCIDGRTKPSSFKKRLPISFSKIQFRIIFRIQWTVIASNAEAMHSIVIITTKYDKLYFIMAMLELGHFKKLKQHTNLNAATYF